ncbi:GDSL-type esterase/lipase family protein [Rheinheimera gaetbuli]
MNKFAASFFLALSWVEFAECFDGTEMTSSGNKYPSFEQSSERSAHFKRMLRYHQRMDGNVPQGAVIFIGDSLIQGLYVSVIAYPSVNYGIGGDTTEGVRHRLAAYSSINSASAVVLAIGINDMKQRSNEEILENYRAIIGQIPKAVPIVISAILPIDEEARDQWQGMRLLRIKEVNSGLKAFAKINDHIYFVDAGSKLIDSSGNLADQYHIGDGLHLNALGNDVWINILRDALNAVKDVALQDTESEAAVYNAIHPTG